MFEWLEKWDQAAPMLTAFIAIFSAIIALIVLIYTRNSNRKRETLNLILGNLRDEDIRKNYTDFRLLVLQHQDDTDFNLIQYAEQSNRDKENFKIITRQLNLYEIIAIGIRTRLLDENFYKDYWHNQFLSDYEAVREFITEVQKQKKSFYCEVTYLYDRWSKNGHRATSTNRIILLWWIIRKKNNKVTEAIEKSKVR